MFCDLVDTKLAILDYRQGLVHGFCSKIGNLVLFSFEQNRPKLSVLCGTNTQSEMTNRDPEGKHLALAQMSPKPALPNKPLLKGQTAGPCSAAVPKLHLLMNNTFKVCSRKFAILGNSWPLHKCS